MGHPSWVAFMFSPKAHFRFSSNSRYRYVRVLAASPQAMKVRLGSTKRHNFRERRTKSEEMRSAELFRSERQSYVLGGTTGPRIRDGILGPLGDQKTFVQGASYRNKQSSHVEPIGRIGDLIFREFRHEDPDLFRKRKSDRIPPDPLARIPVHFRESEDFHGSLANVCRAT